MNKTRLLYIIIIKLIKTLLLWILTILSIGNKSFTKVNNDNQEKYGKNIRPECVIIEHYI